MFAIPLLLISSAMQKPVLDPMIDDVSHRAFNFFWEQSSPDTGFALDRANNTSEKPRKDYVASVASTGFAMAACAVGAERKWVDKKKALERVRLTLKSLEEKTPRTHGWFYHFIDWKTGERQWKCEVSSIDTSICMSGMIVAERYFKDPEITQRADRILNAIDWKWMLTDGGANPSEKSFAMGYHPESGFIGARWDGYSEHPQLYVQAYGLYKAMPADSWDSLKREKVTYKGLNLLVGGPLFIHQMSHVFIDFKGMRDRGGYDYWISTRNAILANRAYCNENPKGFSGYSNDIWGLSACDGPDGYNAFGAPGWISDNGTLAPAAAVAGIMFTPRESIAALKAFRSKYPASYGRYGFVTGLNPTRKWQSDDVIGIDLGQLLLAVENFRDGLPQRLFMSHPIVIAGLKKAGFAVTDEGSPSKRRCW